MARVGNGGRAAAFTLIELLVVVAIIALLISVLLPSLAAAREQARAAQCGAQLRNLGVGLTSYFGSERDWIPGANTSGVALEAARLTSGNNADSVRPSRLPAQTTDWIGPALSGAGELSTSRALRLQAMFGRLGCPSTDGRAAAALYPYGLPANEVPDRADFASIAQWNPVSYLMPAAFQLWGTRSTGTVLWRSPSGDAILAKTVASDWPVDLPGFVSRVDRIGNAAEKVMAADGTRLYDAAGTLLTDVSVVPTDNQGAFAGEGAWWSASQPYGVRGGTRNWDGATVSPGIDYSAGENIWVSYRHGTIGSSQATAVQANRGAINAMFFDGHAVRLSDRGSREMRYWYPKGALVRAGYESQGLTSWEAGVPIP